MPVRFLPAAGGWVLLVLLSGAYGCGASKPIEVEIAPTYNNLRNLTLAYMQATMSLNHPPANAEQLRPFLAKMGDPKELLSSPIDGEELVIHWGVDLRSLRAKGNDWPIWVYEKNAHNGKRWVIQERNPIELTEEQFQQSLFAPGMKKPS